MWSQCVWPSRIEPRSGVPAAAASAVNARPSGAAPVPQSSSTSSPPSDRSSMHDVLPPYRTVAGPGVAIDPRVPQNRALTPPMMPYFGTSDEANRGYAAQAAAIDGCRLISRQTATG
jgi:hypothetical protein